MPDSLFRLLAILLLAIPLLGRAEERLIRRVTVVSPERETDLVNADVLIRNGLIARVSAQPIEAPGAEVIDGTGRYLVPGLIDSHVHLDHATGLKRRYTPDFDRLYREFQQQQPRSYLYYGYTTVIENNGDPAVARAFDAAPMHPRREHCGALPIYNDFLATDFDSSDDFLAAYPNFLHDRHTILDLPEGIDPADHTPAITVERIAATGARCVKLYYEEALWWPGHEHPPFSLPSLAILREVVAAAHARGLTVLMHGNTPAAHRIGLDAGIDVMAHGVWDWAGATGGHVDIPDEVLATADAVAGSAMKLQPTWMAAAGTSQAVALRAGFDLMRIESGVPMVIPTAQGQTRVPAVLTVTEQGKRLVGQLEALAVATEVVVARVADQRTIEVRVHEAGVAAVVRQARARRVVEEQRAQVEIAAVAARAARRRRRGSAARRRGGPARCRSSGPGRGIRPRLVRPPGRPAAPRAAPRRPQRHAPSGRLLP